MTKLRIELALALVSLTLSAVASGQAPAGDACALLAPAEASAALGVKVIPGQHVGASTLTCIFAPSSNVGPYQRQVIVTLTAAQYFGASKRSFGRTTEKPATGVGGDAFYLENPLAVNIHVRKSGRAFELRLNPGRGGKETVAQIEDAEKTLAQKAVPRL